MSIAELEPHTTLPPHDHTQVEALLAQLQEGATTTAVLEAPSGHRVVLPAEIYTVLLDITRAMAEGRAITIAPQAQVLSTQQAADLLGVSRPTLVAILERGEVPYTQPGRHRRVRLTDVLDYQQRQRHTRRAVLDTLTREADELGISDTPAPSRRVRG
jgi:excisionase family DNA binding protein